MDFTDHISRSLGWGGDWSLEVQLTLFQPVGGRREGGDYAHYITAYMKYFFSVTGLGWRLEFGSSVNPIPTGGGEGGGKIMPTTLLLI